MDLKGSGVDSSKIAVVAVLVLVGAVGTYFMVGQGFSTDMNPGSQDNPEDEGGEDESLIGATSASDIEGEIVDVTLGSGTQAEPFRPRISPEDGIRFNNVANHDLVIDFSRSGFADVEVPKGESVVVDVDRMVDYEADTVDDSVDFRAIPGSVNVQ